MVRILIFSFIFLCQKISAQDIEIQNWINSFNTKQMGNAIVPKKFYGNEDLIKPDTSYVLRDVLFMGRMYIGSYGAENKRLLGFFQAKDKLSDSVYIFQGYLKFLDSDIILNGKIELVSSYEVKVPHSISTEDTNIIHTLLWKMTVLDYHSDTSMIAWFTNEMSISNIGDKKILQYMWPASVPNKSFQNVIVGKLRSIKNRSWQFIQLVSETYLLYHLPKNDFLEFNEIETQGSDFPICRIKLNFQNKGWRFTKGDWIDNKYRINKVFGYNWIPF